MAYDPSDLRLPNWLLRLLDWLVRIELSAGRWRFGMTRPGVMLAGVLVGLWLASFYSGNNLLYLCGAMLTALVFSSIWQAVRLLKSVPGLTGSLPAFSVAGEPFIFRESVPGEVPGAALVDISWNAGPAFDAGMQMRLEEPITIRGMIRAEERGLYRPERMVLETSAPLGLWRLSMMREETFEWSVLPRPVPWVFDHVGGKRSTRILEGDELRDLRSYVPGDTLSRIHWRKAASDMSNWSVKRFEQHEGGRQEELLRIDLRLPSGRDAAGQFEQLLGRAWFWIESRRYEQGRFRVILGQQYFDPGDTEGWLALVRALADARPEQRPPEGEGGILLSLAGQS